MEATAMATQDQKLAQIEDMARRIKRVLYWGESRDTASLVHAVLEQWALSEKLPGASQSSSPVDRYALAKQRVVEQLGVDPESLLSPRELRVIVNDAVLLVRVRYEVSKMEAGIVEERAKTLLPQPKDSGTVLSRIMKGKTDHEIAAELDREVLVVESLLIDGIRYLTKLFVTDRGAEVS
jgi:hypothetical protein